MIFLILLGAYLLGSIPFGLLLTKLAGLGDIREIGSGNIGATNVLRTGRKGLAAATLFLDGAKGFAAVVLGAQFGPDAARATGFLAFLGHLFPVWLGFKGGKGVATGLGVLLGLCLPAGLAACATWLAAAFLLRFSSLSALLAFFVAPLVAWALGQNETALLAVVIAGLVVLKHSANIFRLVSGTEPRIGKKA